MDVMIQGRERVKEKMANVAYRTKKDTFHIIVSSLHISEVLHRRVAKNSFIYLASYLRLQVTKTKHYSSKVIYNGH